MQQLKVVCVGGGLGAPTVMRGLRRYTDDITGLIAVTDSGRSTGKVRIALDVPAPGDIRNALAVLSEGDPVLRALFEHRFATDKSPELNGMAFGNLFLAALTQQQGSFLRAVEEASRLLQLRGRVLPVTLYNTHLCARLVDGTTVEEEVNVRATGKAAIDHVYLKDGAVAAADGAVEAIERADLITIGPGSLYTTICACLVVRDVARAIAMSDAPVVYIANTTAQPGQTDDLGVAEHVAAVVDHLGGPGALDIALVNDDAPPRHLLDHYAELGARYLEVSDAEAAAIERTGVRVVRAPVIDRWSSPRELWEKQDTIRHDSERVADALVRLVAARAEQPRLRALS